MRRTLVLLSIAWIVCSACRAPRAGEGATSAALIPRSVLYGPPDRAMVRLSPDGEHLSFLAPVEGVLNVWVGPREDPSAARPVTNDSNRGIRNYQWAFTSRHILYLQDQGGDENWRLYSLAVGDGTVIDLTPFEGTQARIQETSPEHPDVILVGINDRNPQLHDLYRVDIRTGERELVMQNDGFAGFLTDDQLRVRFAVRLTPDGGSALMRYDGEGGFEEFQRIPGEDVLTTNPMGLDAAGTKLYMTDSRGRNTSALTLLDLETGEKAILAEDPRADVSGGLFHPTEKRAEAVSFDYLRQEWKFLDEGIAAEFKRLGQIEPGDISVGSRTLDDRFWIVVFTSADRPAHYYLWNRSERKERFLFSNQSDLEGMPLLAMHPVVIPARDGLSLVSYLTLPVASDEDGDGRPANPVPTILLVHGGPWGRDSFGYHPIHQQFANRGYAVLSVNFRASTGFGKEFTNAGDREWGGKMHDDLLDAVDWAVDEGVALRDKIGIMGGSYGGYATLVGITMTPKIFACGVDIVGPSNIATLLSTIPPYWKPMVHLWKQRVGDWETEEGKAFLEERSPLSHVERIEKPLLIAQGANDPRVKRAESDQIVAAMMDKKIPVTYVLFPDEGHGFARPENNLAFYAVTEAFLAKHLGGRFEPMTKAELEASSMQFEAGIEHLPSVSALVSAASQSSVNSEQ